MTWRGLDNDPTIPLTRLQRLNQSRTAYGHIQPDEDPVSLASIGVSAIRSVNQSACLLKPAMPIIYCSCRRISSLDFTNIIPV